MRRLVAALVLAGTMSMAMIPSASAQVPFIPSCGAFSNPFFTAAAFGPFGPGPCVSLAPFLGGLGAGVGGGLNSLLAQPGLNGNNPFLPVFNGSNAANNIFLPVFNGSNAANNIFFSPLFPFTPQAFLNNGFVTGGVNGTFTGNGFNGLNGFGGLRCVNAGGALVCQ
jgi:hypothetical protein